MLPNRTILAAWRDAIFALGHHWAGELLELHHESAMVLELVRSQFVGAGEEQDVADELECTSVESGVASDRITVGSLRRVIL